MLEDWERITPLEFKNSFAHLWRDENGTWRCKLVDYAIAQDLKAESLKDAIPEVEQMFLIKKYLEPAKRKKITNSFKPTKLKGTKKKAAKKSTKKKVKNANSKQKSK